MAQAALTGIERQLVLDYLIDGNTPVTITPVKKDTQDADSHTVAAIPKDSSRIFPVALRAEQLTVLNQGIILLKNAPENVQAFDGQDVRVQFYFNKLGLYFITTLKRTKNALALVIPEAINRIQFDEPQSEKDLTAVLYYETSSHAGNVHIACAFSTAYRLFVQPKWSDVQEDEQPQAKAYLEAAVAQSKAHGTQLGNGLFLIPVCRYLAHADTAVQDIADRKEPPYILFINHERIVFGCTKGGYMLQQNAEYALKLGFALKNTPVKERSMYVTCLTEALYTSEDGERICAVCRYTSLKKEDERFLYEMQIN